MLRAPLPVLALALALLISACGEPGPPPLLLGLNIALSGELAGKGAARQAVVELAIDEINAAGGVAGRPLALLVRDNHTDAAVAAASAAELADAGVVAMIGPESSRGVLAALPVVRERELVTVSGSATSPDLTGADDGGYFFRTVSSDEYQARAIVRYLLDLASPAVEEVTVVYQDDAYGRALEERFVAAYRARGGRLHGAPIAFPPSLGVADLDRLFAELKAVDARTVVLITFAGDGAKIVQRWDDAGELLDLTWFFTDGVKDVSFVSARPAALVGMRGSAPSHARGEAFDGLARRYAARTGRDVEDTSLVPNYYDAVYLVAAGLTRQAAAAPGSFGGDGLRRALVEVSGPPGPSFHAGAWPAAAARLAAGEDVDYDGASGPVDLDGAGQTIGPYEIWRVVDGTGGPRIALDTYIPAVDLAETSPLAAPPR